MRLALYVCLKNICDGVGGQDESNGTPLDPPLFWLDNIFNKSGKTNVPESQNVGLVVSSHPAPSSDKIIYFSIHTDSAKR